MTNNTYREDNAYADSYREDNVYYDNLYAAEEEAEADELDTAINATKI